MIRITAHNTDPAFLVIRVDREHNGVIGSFEPARRQDDMGYGVYVMQADNLGPLRSWARIRQIHLLDETRGPGEPTKPLECGNIAETWTTSDGRTIHEPCAAPYPAGRIPKFCGACGQPANPVTWDDDAPTSGVRCPACERVNHGGAAYCLRCGAALPDRHLSAPTIARVKGDPQPLSEAVAELGLGAP